MESPRKFNDCYFYYYSTCTKGDNCVFRHEPSALGCETMCTAWQQGKCLDKRCKLRHMELRKNRKQIPCYWENQPGGCRKKHCPFMHKNPDARTDGIAPSQPGPPTPVQPVVSVSEVLTQEPQPLPAGVPTAVPPAPVPLLWQQQRQVVLDSAILGVLPASTELMGGRRVLPPHGHEPAPNPYAPLPVDPLVVNFEEESDNESAPSSTPTKTVSPDEAQRIARTKSQELQLLEQIQAEAAAFYSYDGLPESTERKIIRNNCSTKYERLSLDEIAGRINKAGGDRRKSLDFKVLSLDEIRARKKVSDTIIHSTPITLNLSRKRKLSAHEALTTSGNKIIKVVRSNSVIYKKLDNGSAAPQCKDVKHNGDANRTRTVSEHSDIYDIQEDELLDNCFEFKTIKLVAPITKAPKLLRHRRSSNEIRDDTTDSKTDISDTDADIINIDITDENSNVELSDCEVIDVESTIMDDTVDVVDLSDDTECDTNTNILDIDDLDIINVPDIVASCQKTKCNDIIENDVQSFVDSSICEDL